MGLPHTRSVQLWGWPTNAPRIVGRGHQGRQVRQAPLRPSGPGETRLDKLDGFDALDVMQFSRERPCGAALGGPDKFDELDVKFLTVGPAGFSKTESRGRARRRLRELCGCFVFRFLHSSFLDVLHVMA